MIYFPISYMLKKTHLAIGLAVALYFLPYVKNKFIFIPVVLIASLLPDIDSAFSGFGRHKVVRPIQFFVKHRGLIHSYTICIILSLILAFYFPIFALPFFLGYSFHLLTDSFTVNGIRPFWPFRAVSSGKVVTGGRIDNVIFVTFIILDAFLIVFLVFSVWNHVINFFV